MHFSCIGTAMVTTSNFMFEDLRDSISLLWSGQWPTATGEVTELLLEVVNRGERGEYRRLSVTYKFWAGDDGPYTGEGFWKPLFTYNEIRKLANAKRALRSSRHVTVRYRPSDPSINRIDASSWRVFRK
jgi:hypothetical protein